MRVTVFELMERGARDFLERQSPDGSFPPGHNGPYYDQELPARNTAHVMMLMLRVHEITGERRFRDSALRALGYVTAAERRPMGAAYWMRENPEKDFANGLIGPAWIIEALVYAGRALEDSGLTGLAETLFLLHPFDPRTARWQTVNVDGSYAGVDRTFNHQLWFAAAGGMLKGNQVIGERVERFLDALGNNLKLYQSGLIMHPLGGIPRLGVRGKIKRFAKRLANQSGSKRVDPVVNKAIGYHAFNTYAFGFMSESFPSHAFWASERFLRLIGFLKTTEYRDGLEFFCGAASGKGKALPFNRFGYAYNPPGIEVAFTVQSFGSLFGEEGPRLISEWMGQQLERTYDSQVGLMVRNTDDPSTLAARIYEAVRLADYPVLGSGIR
jgi:hypothetical protein